MKTIHKMSIFVVLIAILALVPGVNATGVMDGSNWTGIDSILDSYGFSYLKSNNGMSNPAITNFNAAGYNVTNATNVTAKNIGGMIYADQYASIQAAVNACPVYQCTVHLGKGKTWSNVPQIIINRSDVTFIGENVTLVPDNSVYGAYSGLLDFGASLGSRHPNSNIQIVGNITIDARNRPRQGDLVVFRGVSDVHINGLIIKANETYTNAPPAGVDGVIVFIGDGISASYNTSNISNIHINNIDISGGGAASLAFYGGYYGAQPAFKDIHITNSIFRDSMGSHGILFYQVSYRQSKNIWIQNNKFINLANSSLYGAAMISADAGLLNFWIQNNEFKTDDTIKDNTGMAINVHSSYDGVISGNNFYNIGVPAAIGGSAIGMHSKRIDIYGNHINLTNNMDWDGSQDVSVHHNIFENSDCSASGIFGTGADRNSFSNNHVINPWRNGTNISVGRPTCPGGSNQNFSVNVADSGTEFIGNVFEVSPAGETTVIYGIFQDLAQNMNRIPNRIAFNTFKNITTPIGLHSSQPTAYSLAINNYGVSPYNFGNNASAPTAFGAGDSFYNSTANILQIYTGSIWEWFVTSTVSPNNIKDQSINFVISNGSNVIGTGIKGDVEIPFTGTIIKSTALADQTGSVNISWWKDSYANFPPTSGDMLGYQGISSSNKGQSTGLTQAVTAGDILRFNVESADIVNRVTISLTVRRS